MLTSEQVLSIVRGGVLAPSADNHHALKFEPTANGLRVWADSNDPARTQPHRKWLSEFSFGAVIENILMKAGECGVTSEAPPNPDPARPALLFELIWRPTLDAPDPLGAAIEKRYTNRKFFGGPPLPPEALSRFAADAARFPTVGLHWCDTSATRKPVLSLLRQAEAERFCQRYLHEELFGSIRWDVGWNTSCDEGLPPGALGVEPPLRPFFKALNNWSVMSALSRLGVHHVLALRAAFVPARLSPHIGVLTTPDDSLAETIAAGRCFQRIWLRATTLGCALQPFAAGAALIRQPAGNGWVSPRTKTVLETGWTRVYPQRRIAMVFRMGNAAQPAVRAGRRPVETYLMARNSGASP